MMCPAGNVVLLHPGTAVDAWVKLRRTGRISKLTCNKSPRLQGGKRNSTHGHHDPGRFSSPTLAQNFCAFVFDRSPKVGSASEHAPKEHRLRARWSDVRPSVKIEVAQALRRFEGSSYLFVVKDIEMTVVVLNVADVVTRRSALSNVADETNELVGGRSVIKLCRIGWTRLGGVVQYRLTCGVDVINV